MEETKVIPVTIQPKNVYGLRSEVIGNIHFNQKQEVIYPVEGVLAFHDYVSNKQRFLRFPERTVPLIIAISPNRKMIAVLELNKSDELEKKQQISIYDLTTLKKRRNFNIPLPSSALMSHFKIASIQYSHDSKSLICLTKPPEEHLILFLFDKSDTIIKGRIAGSNQRGSSECVACNPQDINLIAIGGDNVFKLMTRSDKGFTTNNTLKLDRQFYLTSITWLNMDVLLAGTTNAMLWLLEAGEIKMKLDAREVEILDLLKEQDEDGPMEREVMAETDNGDSPNRIVCLTAFAKGVAYAIFNQVYVFEKSSKYKYERKTILTIKIDIYPESTYQIMNLALNSQQDTVIVTTKHNQIYVGVLIVPESLKTKHLQFRNLGEYIHIDEITDISVCSWKPIIMTASKDQTIRIWNYETEKIELVKKYQVEITVIELNPNGLLAAIGFSDQLRIMEIFMDDFKIIKTYNFPSCKDVRFSYLGHLMAAAHDNLISITSVYNLETLKVLKGHNANVLSIAWSRDDKYLVSGGTEGAVYQWDVLTGARVQEVVQKGVEYRSLAIANSDPISIYGVTSLGTLRELSNSEVIREIKTPSEAPLLSICLSRSDLVMFLSSDQGHLYNVQLPFLDTGGGTCTNYRFFDSAVTKLAISHDGTILVTASKRGTLAIWVLKNIEGRIAPIDQDLLKCEEVLVSRLLMQDKIETIVNLELRLKQQLAEFQHQITQNELFDEQQMNNIHKGYCSVIEELKLKNQDMEKLQVKELNNMSEEMALIKADNDKQMQLLATQYSERMLSEYNKFTHLRENMIEMRDSYEEKLRKSAGCLQDTIEALETDFKNQLHERQDLIRKLMQEMEDKKTEFIEYCRQVEADNDRNMVESQLQFEKRLKDEQDETLKWRGETGVIKKKYTSMSNEADRLLKEIEILKDELTRYKVEIEKNQRISEDLRKEIEEREYVIGEKERRNQELVDKNTELEKYKKVLTHKMNKLEAQIEPRERQIKEKRNQIVEMEHELESLHESNLKLELQLNELKDKYIATNQELKTEKKRARFARNHSTKICSEIYNLAGHLNKPDILKNGVRDLFKKYADDKELKKSAEAELQVKNEFQRQREHLESVALACKQGANRKADNVRTQKLLNDNILLIQELNSVRQQLKENRMQLTNIETIIGISYKNLSPAAIKIKIDKAVTDVEKIQVGHEKELSKCNNKITELVNENLNLHHQIVLVTKDLEVSKLTLFETVEFSNIELKKKT